MGIFQNKVVIVTGAGSGIGRATAQSFAREGGRVIVADINERNAQHCATDIQDAGGVASAVACDVGCDSSLRKMFEFVASEFGGVHILISNAGALMLKGSQEATAQDWSQSFATNVTAAALCARHAAGCMRNAGGGAIVVIASISGSKAEPGFATYNSSKAALLMLMRSMAIEYGRWNIRVNAVSPGPVDTPGLRKIIENENENWDVWKEKICRLQCLPTMTGAEDVAKAVLFLCSDAARMITGANLVIDGGLLARTSWL